MEINHNNRNSNQRPPQNFNQNRQKPSSTVPGRPKEQKHILAELKAKYGPNFIGVADVYGEFSRGPAKLTQLLRTIFKGQFNFEEYGPYLLDPRIMDRLIELAYSNAITTQIHYVGAEMILWNPQVAPNYGIDLNNVAREAMICQDKMNLWFKIYDILWRTKMTSDLNHFIMGVNEVATLTAQSPTVKDISVLI